MKLKNKTKSILSIRDCGNLIIVNPGQTIEVRKPEVYNRNNFTKVTEEEKIGRIPFEKKKNTKEIKGDNK